jgi:hypothetical protein
MWGRASALQSFNHETHEMHEAIRSKHFVPFVFFVVEATNTG